MGAFVLRRLALLIPIWFGISLIAFALANLTPGDPARLMLQRTQQRQPTAAEVQQARHDLQLDRPFVVRYASWMRGALQGDLGQSYRTGAPVLRELLQRFPATLKIAGLAMVFAVTIAIPLGVVAALKRNTPIDHISRIIALLMASMPNYWVAYLLILLFSVKLGVLPVVGTGSWRHLILPSVTLGLASCASLMRLTRAELLEVISQDYVRTARAKGLANHVVVVRHALRNALVMVVTVAGMRFAGLLGGAVIIETIFAWPGIGKFVLDSIFDRDYPVIQGFVVLTGTSFLLINLLVDISYAWLDPRLRVAAHG